MYLPQIYLQKAIITKLKALGYAVSGLTTFPRVEVWDFITTPTGAKEDKQYIVTFLLDIISNKSSLEALNILESIRGNFTFTVEHFIPYILIWEQQTESEETGEGNNVIYRQIQRVRMELEEL